MQTNEMTDEDIARQRRFEATLDPDQYFKRCGIKLWPRRVVMMTNEVVPEQLRLVARAMQVGKPEARKLAMKLMELGGTVLDLERRLRDSLGTVASYRPRSRKRQPGADRKRPPRAERPKPPPRPARRAAQPKQAISSETLNELVVKHLTRFSDDTFQAASLTKALELAPRRVTSVAASLVNLTRTGHIQRVGRGEYQGKDTT